MRSLCLRAFCAFLLAYCVVSLPLGKWGHIHAAEQADLLDLNTATSEQPPRQESGQTNQSAGR